MFRKKGGGATGIMASGPELIKRANGGTFSFGNIPSAIKDPDFYGKIMPLTYETSGANLLYRVPKAGVVSNVELEVPDDFEFGRVPTVTASEYGAIPGTTASEDEKVTVDSAEINKKNKELLKKEEKPPKGKNLGFRIDQSDPMPGETDADIVSDAEAEAALKPPSTATSGFDLTGTRESILKEQKAIQDAYQAFNLGEIDKANILGDTYENHTKNFFKTLNKRPEEVTFEDVKDSAFDMLGYDKESRKQQLTEDQESSIWLNLMRAGLAIAAGGSENTLTNVARGFSIGLEGYGKDMRNLTDDYREDINKYQTTMYQLLRDKKSENIAMNALDVQRKTAELAVINQLRGEQRADALQKLNSEVTMRKLKIQTLSTLHQINFDKLKLDKSDAEFQKSMEINLAKIASMLPKEILAAQADGFIEVIDETKPLTADNLKLTQKGIDAQFSIVSAMKETTKTRTTDTGVKRDIAGKAPGYGIQYIPNAEISTDARKAVGEAMINLRDRSGNFMAGLGTQGFASDALSALVLEFEAINDNYPGTVTLDFKKLPNKIKKAYRDKTDEQVVSEIDRLAKVGPDEEPALIINVP